MIVVERVTKATDTKATDTKTVVDELSLSFNPGVVKGFLGPDGSTSKVRVRRRAIRQVLVLAVAGRLADVVEDLDWVTRLALANGPRGVTCDLSRVEDADPDAVAMLARDTRGRGLPRSAGSRCAARPLSGWSPDPRRVIVLRHIGGAGRPHGER